VFYIRQNATHKVAIGPFVDVGDGFTPQTDITLGGNEAEAILHDNATVVDISAYTWAALANCRGYYNLTLQSGITSTVGHVTIVVQDDSDTLPVKADFTVVEEAIYDAFFAGSATGLLPANVTQLLGTAHLAPAVAGTPDVNAIEISGDATTANNLQVLFDGVEGFFGAYAGPRGPGVYLNDAAANTSTTSGVDGTIVNPVSTIAAAKTIADALALDRIYLMVHADITLAATMEDYEFIGIGEVTSNVINLGSQDVDRSSFYNLTVEGTQGGTGRIYAQGCALQDPGAGATTLHIFAYSCGIVDDISVDTSADNVFDQCYSLVAGSGTPIITATGAAGTISIRHYSGGIELSTLSASHNISVETDGQVIFTADCNVNASVSLRGNMSITDNTAGMNSLTTEAVYDKRAVISDIHSRLVVIEAAIDSDQLIVDAKTSDTHSLLTVVEAAIDSDQALDVTAVSNVHSRLVVVESAIDSDQTSRTASISDVHSLTTVVNAKASDTHSRLVVVETAIDSDQVIVDAKTSDTHSRLVVIEASIDSDQLIVDAKTSDTHSRLVVVESAIDSDQTSRATAISDTKSALTIAASDIIAIQDGYVESATKAGTLSTTQCSTDLTQATADHYIGCLIVFMDGVNAGQRSDVTDYVGTNGVLTFTAMTDAPGAGDTFRLY